MHGLALDRSGVEPEDYLAWMALGLSAPQVAVWARSFEDADQAQRFVQAGFTDPWLADRWDYYLGSEIEAATARALADLDVPAEDAPYLLDEVTDELRRWDPTALLIVPKVVPDPVRVAAQSRARDLAAILVVAVGGFSVGDGGTGTVWGSAQFTISDAVLCALAGFGLGEVRAVGVENLDRNRVRFMAALRGDGTVAEITN